MSSYTDWKKESACELKSKMSPFEERQLKVVTIVCKNLLKRATFKKEHSTSLVHTGHKPFRRF